MRLRQLSPQIDRIGWRFVTMMPADTDDQKCDEQQMHAERTGDRRVAGAPVENDAVFDDAQIDTRFYAIGCAA